MMTARVDSQWQQINPADYGRVAVLMGGCSAEREVSLASGRAVLDGLRAAGVDAFTLDAYGPGGGEDLIEQLQRQPIHTVVNMLHGGVGEDGSVPCLLKFLGIPCTGNGVLASALALDKVRCKLLWQGMGLPTADFVALQPDSDSGQVVASLGLPLMVKPAREGSSMGMTKVTRRTDLAAAYQLAARYDQLVLAERWLNGGEYTVAVLKGKTLPVIHLETAREFYDYQAKYVDDDTQYHIPSGLSADREQEIKRLALRAFDSLGCSGWGRVDLMTDEQGRFHILEINTVPGMTSHSLVPKAAHAAGLAFEQLVLQILSTARVQ